MAAKKSTSKYDRLAPPKILKRDPNTSLEAKSATSLTTCAIDMQRGQKQYRILKNVNNNDKNKQLNQNEVIKDRFAHKSDHGNGKTITPTVPDVIDKPIGRHELPWRKRSNKESNIDATVQKTHPSALKPEFDDFKQEKSILQKQKSNTEASKEYLNKKLYMDLQTQQGRKHSTYNNRKENSATTGKHSRNFENMNSHVHRQSQNLTSNNAEFVSPTNGSNLTLKNQLTSQKHQRKGHKKSLTQPDTVTSVSKIVSASSVVTPKQSKFFGKNPFEELITLQDLEAIANESDYTSQPIEMEADRFNNTNEPIQIVSLKELESITSDKKSKFTLQKRFDISPSAEKPKSTERWKFNLMDKPEFSKPIQIPDERELSIDRVLDNIAKLKTSNSESNLAQSTKSTEVVNGDLKIGNSSKSGKKEFRFTVVKKSGSVNYVE
ncbi:hypothetical protein BC833DRAFT_598979 [Globomyces pollinis-pini]|nr:hypothetical protein BC833DRAFT_598979 [Globomyces pollinis-pini]